MLSSGSPDINYNTIAFNNDTAVYLYSGSSISVNNNLIMNNTNEGIFVNNLNNNNIHNNS